MPRKPDPRICSGYGVASSHACATRNVKDRLGMPTTIVVGVNNQATALAAYSQAMSLAKMSEAQVHLVYAIDAGDPNAEAIARRHADGLLSSLQLSTMHPVTVHTVIGRPHEAILAVAQEHRADLIVVGNKGLTRRHRFTKEAPAQVLRYATCSVLVVDTSGEAATQK